MNGISKKRDILVVVITDTKPNPKRTFTVNNGDINKVSRLEMYRKYASLHENINNQEFHITEFSWVI